MTKHEVVEICAGAGGQALGLEKAGFEHALAIELDENACNTLRTNRSTWKVAEGDVADLSVWDPADYEGVALLAGGVPCPPFSIAGRQLGASDERDLFAWAVEQVAVVRPRALLLENVRGLSMPRFTGYRQHVLDRLTQFGYVAEWRLLHASDFGVPQLRPRFILVALKPEDAPYFRWPEPRSSAPTVGETLIDLMASNGWHGAKEWAKRADKIAPTIVGGSKKHGGADLGPTRAKRAWAALGVDALGIADAPPSAKESDDFKPKLTCEMVARIQGWSDEYTWEFTGRKTSRYRQIGNAFPPPVAHAVGSAIMRAFHHEGTPKTVDDTEHDPIYKTLRASSGFVTPERLMKSADLDDRAELERRIGLLSRDFEVEIRTEGTKTRYRLGSFKAFIGQEDHARHDLFLKHRARIS
ncbi:DNA cytosine methyltransferase [Saccharomonospora xinjiangensis]|uniref:DNA (cytosine-5-)-methyltransferase n=1 Tax=Saccharomonospora xinjiangensis XJ-54 TaxID=882086 RepID=I0V4T7_9PSEU|nr:DNA (cytosine-5-)-methyltransferase [Saccharomonospora xinjiangensis]EID55140.1 DNA-methyltransferase Dcm [Saccharomonospora xinjiangensis XJ-54]